MTANAADAFCFALADAAAKSGLVLAAALLAWPFARKASAACKHLLWFGALAGALLVPLLTMALPAWPVAWLPTWGAQESAERGTLSEEITVANPEVVVVNSLSLTQNAELSSGPAVQLTPPGVQLETQTAKPETPNPKPKAPDDWPQTILFVWLAGVVLALLPLAAGLARAAWLTRRGQKLDGPDWNADLNNIARQLGLRRQVRVRAAPGVAMPFTWGAFRPVVLFPENTAEWPESRRRLVLLHELGHVARLDWATQILGALACAVYWFNPLAWLAARQMRLEREQACDDLVLRCGETPRHYARELLAFAATASHSRLLDCAAVPMARRSTLESRLLAILDGERQRGTLTRTLVLMVVILFAAVATPLAMLRAATPVPTPKSAESEASVAQFDLARLDLSFWHLTGHFASRLGPAAIVGANAPRPPTNNDARTAPGDALPSSPSAPETTQAIGQGIVQAFIVSGDVIVLDPAGAKTLLKKADVLLEGNTVLTGNNGMALLVFSNGATLRIPPDTTLQITRFQQAPFDAAKEGGTFLRLTHDPSRSNVELLLTRGEIAGEVRKLNEPAGSTFVINTPAKSNLPVTGVYQVRADPFSFSTHAAGQAGTVNSDAVASAVALDIEAAKAENRRQIAAIQADLEVLLQKYDPEYLDPKKGLLTVELKQANRTLVDAKSKYDVAVQTNSANMSAAKAEYVQAAQALDAEQKRIQEFSKAQVQYDTLIKKLLLLRNGQMVGASPAPPATAPPTEANSGSGGIETRTFYLSQTVRAILLGPSDTVSAANEDDHRLTDFFTRAGVEFPDGANLTYDGQKISLTNTPANLDHFARILARYDTFRKVRVTVGSYQFPSGANIMDDISGNSDANKFWAHGPEGATAWTVSASTLANGQPGTVLGANVTIQTQLASTRDTVAYSISRVAGNPASQTRSGAADSPPPAAIVASGFAKLHQPLKITLGKTPDGFDHAAILVFDESEPPPYDPNRMGGGGILHPLASSPSSPNAAVAPASNAPSPTIVATAEEKPAPASGAGTLRFGISHAPVIAIYPSAFGGSVIVPAPDAKLTPTPFDTVLKKYEPANQSFAQSNTTLSWMPAPAQATSLQFSPASSGGATLVLHARPTSGKIIVTGAVNKPGLVVIPPGEPLTLASAIAHAGGLAANPPTQGSITRSTSRNTWDTIGFTLPAALGDAQSDTPLHDGDSVYVGERAQAASAAITITGEVAHPLNLLLAQGANLNLSEAMVCAGFSTWSNHTVTLVRYDKDHQKQEQTVNVDELLQNSDKDVDLQPGDAVVVPAKWLSFKSD